MQPEYPIPAERPERLQGPEVGTLCVAVSKYDWLNGKVCRVVERSYVWAPGDPAYYGGARRYDWKVIEYDMTPSGKPQRVVVNDTDLRPLKVGDVVAFA